MEQTYDCSPKPQPEKLTHHVSRTVHNIFHPHHRVSFIAPMVLSCKMPEMETVVITADSPVPKLDTPGSGTPGSGGGYYPDEGGGELYTASIETIGAQGYNTKPVAVPAPDGWITLIPGVIAVILLTRRRRARCPL